MRLKKIKSILIKVILSFVVTVTLFIGLAYASIFGEENAMLGKILLEDVQQTFHLKDIIGFAKDELKLFNAKYGYEKWINKGLNSVKDYGFLEHVKTDDYMLSIFQNDFANMGITYNADDYNMDNFDQWIDQIWAKAPEYINVNTEYPGNLDDWKFQVDNNLEGQTPGYTSLWSMVNRKSAVLSYKQAMWNMKYDEKLRLRLQDLLLDTKDVNPGEAARQNAQANTLQNIQLSNINSTQSGLLRLMSERTLNHLREDNIKQFSIKKTFQGCQDMLKSIPTLGK